MPQNPSDLESEWRDWVTKFGCRTLDLDPKRHDELCAWVSHLPQFVSTAMSASAGRRRCPVGHRGHELRQVGRPT